MTGRGWTEEDRDAVLLVIGDCSMLQHYPDGSNVPAYDEETGDKLYVCQVHEDSEPTTRDDYCPAAVDLTNSVLRTLLRRRSPGERRLAGQVLWTMAHEPHDVTCFRTGDRRGVEQCTCWKKRLRALLPDGEPDPDVPTWQDALTDWVDGRTDAPAFAGQPIPERLRDLLNAARSGEDEGNLPADVSYGDGPAARALKTTTPPEEAPRG